MSDGLVSQGTKLEMGTGAGGAVTTVTAAVGYPTIITKASHGLTNGTVVTLSAFAGASAALMNDKVVVVKNVTKNTLAVDIDTTGGTLTASNGTLTPVAWTEIAEVTDWDGPSGTAQVIDMTYLTATAKHKKPGIPDEGQFTLSINWIPTDAGQQAVATARAEQAEKNFRVTYEDGSTQTFAGYVLGFATSGGVDNKVAGSITIEITGAVTTTPAA
jgi:hypothetical protein